MNPSGLVHGSSTTQTPTSLDLNGVDGSGRNQPKDDYKTEAMSTHLTRINAFEVAWVHAAKTPDIRDFVDSSGDADAIETLQELICLDLEFRSRKRKTDPSIERRSLETYFDMFPQLGLFASASPLLIEEEYRSRKRCGDRVNHADFSGRFPVRRRAEVLEILRVVDEEERRERHVSRDYDASTLVEPFPQLPEAASSSSNLIEHVLDFRNYRLIRQIGAGQTGKVYEALCGPTQQMVAIKYLRKRFHRQASAVRRFLREAEILATIRRPHVIHMDGFGRTKTGGYFMVMELMREGDLGNRIAKERLTIASAKVIFRQICTGMGHAHELGIVHCDLKPGNVLLRNDGSAVVTDFGLARSLDESSGIAAIQGTAPFMAPEQVSPWWGPIGPQTDIHGLGAILYTMLTGTPPYGAASMNDALARAASGARPRGLHELRPDVSTELSELCSKCLSKKPTERFPSVRELIGRLDEIRGDEVAP